MPRFLALAGLGALVVLAVAAAAGSSSSSSGRVSDRAGLIGITLQRCAQILAIPSTGAGKRNLSRDLACNLDPVWSHDGEVAFFKIQGPKRGIALMQPDGSGQRFVIDGPASRLRWAPTGRRLLYFAEYGHPRVVDLDGGTDRDLAPVDSPEWSPDGSEIAGVSIRQLTIQRPDGSGLRTIATTRFVGGILGWSTSGAITFSASDGFIWTIRPDGSHERRITAGFSGTSSPDGSRLAVLRSVNSPSQVVVARADGSDVVVISEDGESVPTWSPDGNKIAFRAGMRTSDRGRVGRGTDGRPADRERSLDRGLVPRREDDPDPVRSR